ncbi:hypothetical protein [uncultured Clostridium sp.]|uniref:hypothetical protein n=1 Tax=uncultured Clostridium sp. TaxID=59620 RepID=UPI00261934C6|nr:hypothetical protein [uncultured Clostridium sp.]
MNELKIKCPNCETEYLPGEIFLPRHFLGEPKDIEKDYTGKIVDYAGTEQNLTEEYICDKCSKKFYVKANITYTTFKDKLKDLDEEYTSNKYGDRLQLEEE